MTTATPRSTGHDTPAGHDTTEQETYEVELALGATVAEVIRLLGTLPADAVFVEHFGDVDLLAHFHHPRAAPPPS